MLLDWATSYKFFLVISLIFHPREDVRKFSFYFSLSLFIHGVLKLHFLDDNMWYLVATCSEVVTLILAYKLLERNWQTLVILLQCFIFIGLNIRQYLGWYQGSIFYDSFLSTKDYIYWNKWGFEVILLMLWMKDEVFSAIRSRWTVNNVIMVYVIGWIVYLAGNY